MKGLKVGVVLSFTISLAILLIGGFFAKDKVAPYPEKVMSGDRVVTTAVSIKNGQDVYQRYGLMDHGSVWGHGSLRGPDFSATTLHKIGEHMRDFYAAEKGTSYSALTPDDQSSIDAKVISEIKKNQYDPSTQSLTVTPAQAYAFDKVKEYWKTVFVLGDRKDGFLPGTVRLDLERDQIADFFFWTAWVAGANRPGENSTYTNNWPNDRSVGNALSSDAFIWSVLSIIALLVMLGLIIYVVHRFRFFYGEPKGVKVGQMLTAMPLTNSQFKAAKYFLVVSLLFLLQLTMGGLLAHYTVHPGKFFFPFIAELIPYSWAKTWHLQLAIFWIATSWVGAAIYLAPLISGREPKKQGLLVDILFIAILFVALGSLFGEALSIKGHLGSLWFWLGHQGWEYLELGRIWQILLWGGLIAWLFIVYRALKDKLFGPNRDTSGLVLFYTLSAVMIVLFFGFGFFYGKGTHLTIADYWRWFVVHLWVESMFEFFGVAVIALFLVVMGLVDKASAMKVAYLTAILVFASGIVGTAHHYFWFGGPTYWLALGGVFSSLEPIPLILLVTRTWMEYKSTRDAGADFPYKWPLYFLVASSFWNFLGAGVFGFSMNLPVVNYYSHATYLTSNHAHTALFGVYGMLSVSMVLFTWRSLVKNEFWSDATLKMSFWGMNGGLFLMFALTLLPIGVAQTISSYTDGFWLAKSSEFYARPMIQTLGMLRALPDAIIILFGALPLFVFLIRTYPHLKPVRFRENEDLFKEGENII